MGVSMSGIGVEELRRIVREEVRRALLEFLIELLPMVSEDEQRDRRGCR